MKTWARGSSTAQARQQEQTARHRAYLCQIPINRIVFAFMGYNDEQWIASSLYGDSQLSFWVTVAIVLAFTLPPLIAAYREIRNRRPWLWFLGFFTLPFAFIVLFAGLFLEENLLLELQVLSTPIFGIPYLLVLVEVVCTIGYMLTKKYLYKSDGRVVAAFSG